MFLLKVRSHLPFLTRFLETQMFTVFVDRSIEHLVTAADNQRSVANFFETPFEVRLRTLREAYGESLVRTPTYKECQVTVHHKHMELLSKVIMLV